MKIAIEAFLLTCLEGGLPKSLIYLMNNVAKLDAGFEGICFWSGKKLLINDFSFASRKIRYRRLPFDIGGRLLCRQVADCDFLHYHANGGVFPFAPREKNVLVLHDVLPVLIPGFFRKAKHEAKYRRNTQNSLDNAGVIFTTSSYSKRTIKENFRVKSPIAVLPYAPTIEAPSGGAGESFPDKDGYYIYVGGYDRRKGMEKILKSFIASPKKRKLCFVGQPNYFSGEFELLAKKAKTMGILEEKGYVGQNTLAQLIRNAQALIYPSKWEGFGLPPLEAMRLGTPVFATKGTSVPEVCGEAPIYFEPDDEEDLISKIREFEEGGQDLRQELIARGHARAAMFSWQKTAEKYLAPLRAANQMAGYD
jgi:glycosyltransferase involved in cell wall biosynthesis